MKRLRLQDMTVEQLVARFTEIALAQDRALAYDEIAKYNRLFDQSADVMAEFMVRPIEQRQALMALYDHPSAQVRYEAAVATVDFAPEAARPVFETIIERNEYPQAANARGFIEHIDKGPVDMSWILKRRKT
jgi:hypothetical protein